MNPTTTRHVTDLIAPDATVTDYPIVIRETVINQDGSVEICDYTPANPVIDNGNMVFNMPQLQHECGVMENAITGLGDYCETYGITFSIGTGRMLDGGNPYLEIDIGDQCLKLLDKEGTAGADDIRRVADGDSHVD